MKNILLSLTALMIFACTAHQKQEGYVIKGTIKNLKQKNVYLFDDNNKKLDSCRIDSLNGRFELNGKVEFPEFRYLRFEDGKSIALFVENSIIAIKGDSIESVKITGSKSQDEYIMYSAKVDSINKEYTDLRKKFNSAKLSGDSVLIKSMETQLLKLSDVVYENQRNYSKIFVKNNSSSFVAPYVLWWELSYDMEIGEMDSLVKSFDTIVNKSIYIQFLNERIELLKKVAIGQPAPDFIMNDTLGNPVKLSSLFGKVLLVDFWASWCGPCRRENPNIVSAYKDFHKKGFEILGVSLDGNRQKWTAAIRKDNLSWHHVSDLQSWNNAAAKLYAVRSIPANILLDKNGLIIARNLIGEDKLRKKLTELLSK